MPQIKVKDCHETPQLTAHAAANSGRRAGYASPTGTCTPAFRRPPTSTGVSSPHPPTSQHRGRPPNSLDPARRTSTESTDQDQWGLATHATDQHAASPRIGQTSPPQAQHAGIGPVKRCLTWPASITLYRKLKPTG